MRWCVMSTSDALVQSTRERCCVLRRAWNLSMHAPQRLAAPRRCRILAREVTRHLAKLRLPAAGSSTTAHLAGVVQEGGVETASNGVVAAESEGDVGHAATDLAARAQPLDLARRPAQPQRLKCQCSSGKRSENADTSAESSPLLSADMLCSTPNGDICSRQRDQEAAL